MVRTPVPRIVALVTLLVLGVPAWLAARADNPTDLGTRKDRQRQVRSDTDHLVRRLATVLRVLDYYRLDKATQQKTIEEVAVTLHGLSRAQMREVVARLEAAARAPDPTKSEEELEAAYERHREVLSTLKALLARYDALKTLDQAAERAARIAKAELELHLQTANVLGMREDLVKPGRNPAQAEALLQQKLGRPLAAQVHHQADEQNDLQRQLTDLLRQAGELKPHLPVAQQKRIEQAEMLAAERRLPETMKEAATKLLAKGARPDRDAHWKEANTLQRRAADDLRELARILRTPADKVSALREAAVRLDRAIHKQQELHDQARTEHARLQEETAKVTKAQPPAKKTPELTFPGLTALPKQKDKTAAKPQLPDPVREKASRSAREMTNEQVRLEHEARDTRDLLDPQAKEAAQKLAPAEEAMRRAEDVLRKQELAPAAQDQEKAVQALKEARQEVERQLAEAQKKGAPDPLAALQKAADNVEKILQEQKDVRAKTKDADTPAQRYQLPLLAGKQQELAKRAEGLKDDQPPLVKPQVPEALAKAAKAMEEAGKALDEGKGEQAQANQDQAIKALQEAQKEVGEKIAEIARRREEIAKLQQAGQKLDALAKEQGHVADKAQDLARQPAPDPARELGTKQGELTPRAKEIGKEIADAAPQAAQKVKEGAGQMEAAKHDLQQNKPADAAREAMAAAKALEQAREEVAKALGERKGQEISDQAALEPKGPDPAGAAQQLAKAIEQTEQALDQSKQAARAGAKPHEMPAKAQADKDLAALQQKVAEQAAKLGLKDAVKPAGQAAEALKQSDLEKAVGQQEQSLAKLEEAKAVSPDSGEPKAGQAKPGEPMPGEPKAGEPSAGEPKSGAPQADTPAEGNEQAAAKPGQAKPASKPGGPDRPEPKAGEPKGGEPNAGEPKGGDPTGGEPKAGEPKPGTPDHGTEPDAGRPKAGEVKPATAKAGEPKGPPAQASEAKGGAEPGGPHEGAPDPAEATTPAQLAQAQKAVLDATKALAKSQQATESAMTALGQAQSQAPPGVQPQLQEAGKQLAEAGKKLEQAQPAPAGQAQEQALGQMKQALDALNAALTAMGQQPAQPGQKPTALAKSEQPGQEPGPEPGQEPDADPQAKAQPQPGQKPSPKRGPAMEKNQPKGMGNRLADGRSNNAKSELADVRGDGSFLGLPPRQREMIRQALSGQLPPEYAGMIQQYYVNIARGRPAAAAPPKR